MHQYKLLHNKETKNKHRWICHVDDVEFYFYIPKHVLPDDIPDSIRVTIEDESQNPREAAAQLRAVVKLVDEPTKTARYCPVGDPEEWVIGQPYIPYGALPHPLPKRLVINVFWK